MSYFINNSTFGFEILRILEIGKLKKFTAVPDKAIYSTEKLF